MSKTKVSIGVIAVTVLTVATLFLLPLPPRTEVQTAVISRGNMLETVLLEGVVACQDQQALISPAGGQVDRVWVSQGDRVVAGQLLFSLDTVEEETVMAQLTAEIGRLDSLDGSMQALLTRQRLEMQSRQAEVKKSIAMKQIRAQQDGVLGVVCCRAGDWVTEGAVLGSMHGDGLCVTAFLRADAAQNLPGDAAAYLLNESGQRVGKSRLLRMGSPQQDAATGIMGYPLWFSLEEDLPLGQRVTVEVVMKSWEAQTLAPVEAVSGGGCLWVVEDGVARPVQVEVLRQDGSFVSVDGSLEGARVILQPDEQKLSPGRPVREGTP